MPFFGIRTYTTLKAKVRAAAPGLVLWAVVLVLLPTPAPADTVIYYNRDKEGVYHFTNKPTTANYKVYMVFREALKNSGKSKSEILEIARKYSRRYGLDVRLVEAVIEVESAFEPSAVSSAGAEGLMQIMPSTQRDLGVTDPFDPDNNIEAGVRYLRSMINRFGTLELALAAYNAGPQNVIKYNGIPPFAETQDYVKKVLRRYKQ